MPISVEHLPRGHEDELIDVLDQKVVLTHIMQQAVDDYTKLVHPGLRTKKYLQEHYLTAIDFLFDPEYRLGLAQNDDGEDLCVVDLIKTVLGTEKNELADLQAYAIRAADTYWKEKRDVSAVDHIPDTVFIEGHVFNVEHAVIKKYTVDIEGKTITLDKTDTQANHENFFEAVMYATCYLIDSKVKLAEVRKLSHSMFQMLKANACFSQLGVARMKDLFVELRQEL